MSIAALAVEAVPPPGGHVRAAVAGLERAMRDAVGASWADVAGGEVLDLVDRIGRLGSQLSALRLTGLAEAERQEAARRVGMTSTGAWLRSTGVRAGAAHRDVALAHELDGLAATREALGGGAISAEHAAVVAQTLAGLSAEVDEQGRARARNGRCSSAPSGWTPPGWRRRHRASPGGSTPARRPASPSRSRRPSSDGSSR